MTRNIDIGTVVDKVFKTYQRYFVVLISIAAVVFVIEAAFRFVGEDHWWLSFIGLVISIVLTQLYTGTVVELVDDTRDGTLDASVGGLVSKVMPVLGTLIGAAIVSGIAIFCGFIACIIPGIVLLTLWSVTAPAIVVERLGVFEALSRSWNLVKTNFWQTLGVIFIFWVIALVITWIAAAIVRDTNDLIAAIVIWIVSFLLAPLKALASSILFFELRGAESGAPEPPSASPTSTWGAPEAP
jgi:hypothetical protein